MSPLKQIRRRGTAEELSSVTTIGKKIHRARLSRGASLQELADTIGGTATASYLSKIENGVIKEPNSPTLLRLASVFGWTIDDLLECFSTDEELSIDNQIAALEQELAHDPSAKPVIAARRQLRGNMKGKKIYLSFLQVLKDDQYGSKDA